MHLNRRLLFWGLGFVTAGLVALAIQFGYLETALAGTWRLWPLILVALGISLILSRTRLALVGTALAAIVVGAGVGTAIAVGPSFASGCSDSPPGALQDHSGTLGSGASLDWRLDCGTLSVSMSQGSSWRASVGSTGEDVPTVDADSEHLDLKSSNQGGGFFFGRERERWNVKLPSASTYQAKIHINAAKATLDLTGAKFSALSLQPNATDVLMTVDGASIEGFDVTLNAGSLAINASAGTALSGNIQMNAGSVELCAPADMALRISARGTAFSTNLSESDLNPIGDTWESATYAQADHRVTLTVRGNAASFDLEPPGECQ